MSLQWMLKIVGSAMLALINACTTDAPAVSPQAPSIAPVALERGTDVEASPSGRILFVFQVPSDADSETDWED